VLGDLVSLDPQWLSLALLALLLVSQIGRWSKRAEEKTGLDSIRVRLEPVFVSKELYDSELSAALERIRRLERKIGINGRADQHSHIE
jgi:hypothetical protein